MTPMQQCQDVMTVWDGCTNDLVAALIVCIISACGIGMLIGFARFIARKLGKFFG